MNFLNDFYKFLIKQIILSDRISLIEERKNIYGKNLNLKEIKEIQISNFNKVWSYSHNNIFFYKNWKKKHRLPSEIKSFGELDNFPILSKKDLIISKKTIVKQFKNYNYISTGGSTGEPTKFPIKKKDSYRNYADSYMARSWWGVNPLDNMVLLWGHSHLFGTGIKGQINHKLRLLKDILIKTKRLNAYDISPETIKKYYKKICKIKPEVIIGYTSCIFKLARFMLDNNLEGSLSHNLKAVIPTAETITENDLLVIQKAFLRPVVVEYGMAETGVIGYSFRETWNIKVFWDSFLARKLENNRLIISHLYKRTFPLINYQTDDCIIPKLEEDKTLFSFSKVTGRKKENLQIGTVEKKIILVSGILIIHIMKSYPFIYSIQTEQLEDNKICIFLNSDRLLNLEKIKAFFKSELSKDHRQIDFENIIFKQVETSQLSLSGKEILVKK